MKTKTLSILFALVMVLSLSAGVFAQDFNETWDEETVLTVFSDLDLVFPDMFADADSDFLWVTNPNPDGGSYPSEFPGDPYNAKAPIETTTIEGVEFTYDPCGDGLLAFTVTLPRVEFDATADYSTVVNEGLNKYGPEQNAYIRNITATVDGNEAMVKKCSTKGADNCNVITFNKKGEAKISGFLYYPEVLTADDKDLEVKMTIKFSNYFTALWNVDWDEVEVSGTTVPNTKRDYCQDSLAEVDMANVYSVRAKYDQHTGEARFQAVIRNFAQETVTNGDGYTAKTNYVIPADILVPYLVEVEAEEGEGEGGEGEGEGGEGEAAANTAVKYERYTDYTCKYTVYNTNNGAPRTDYCEFGKGIALASNAIIRFDITVNNLSSNILLTYPEQNIPFNFRVGGMPYLVGKSEGEAQVAYDATVDFEGTDYAAFAPVDFPCPIVSRMVVMDPLKPFMTFFEMDSDDPIDPSGAYGVYDGGLWGLYQKCGKYAYMAVRLKNDGIQEEVVNLNNVAVAVNGGTPMSWKWVLSSQPEAEKGKIELNPGEDVVLIGRAKVTDYGYQMNSDLAITGAVNFLDYGFYIQGKVYSDHNNTNCTVAP